MKIEEKLGNLDNLIQDLMNILKDLEALYINKRLFIVLRENIVENVQKFIKNEIKMLKLLLFSKDGEELQKTKDLELPNIDKVDEHSHKKNEELNSTNSRKGQDFKNLKMKKIPEEKYEDSQANSNSEIE